MKDPRVLEVIDLAYQAALDPSLWIPAMQGATQLVGGSSSAMLWPDYVTGGSGGLAVGGDPALMKAYNDHFHDINPIQNGFDRMTEQHRLAQPVMTDRACVDRGQLLRTEYFADFMRACDHGSAMLITGVDFRVNGRSPAFNIFRAMGEDEFDAAEIEIASTLRKPFHRAYQMSGRLARERQLGESLEAFVSQLAGGVMLVHGDGRVAYANPAGEALLAARDGLACDAHGLRASTPDAQRRLAALMAAATQADPALRRGGALSLPRPSGRRPLALLATPAGSQSNAATGALALISAVDPELGGVAPEERLRAYFGFTAAEARVAAEMIAGYDPAEIAERLGRSIHTVRQQIARVREQTDTTRQGEAIALMMRVLGGSGRAV